MLFQIEVPSNDALALCQTNLISEKEWIITGYEHHKK